MRFGVNICEDVWGAEGAASPRVSPNVDGVNVGINICADVWEPEAPKLARGGRGAGAAGAERLALSHRQAKTRYDVMRERSAETGMSVVFCNLVGGQDELVFDGASFVMDARRQAHASAARVRGSARLR